MDEHSINLFCPIGHTGYGITSANIAIALNNMRVPISLFPIGQINANNEHEQNFFHHLINNNRFFNYDAPCLKIWHQFDLGLKIGRGHYYVYPFFELDKFYDYEIHHLNFANYLFVASQWAKDILIQNKINKPIYVAPLAVDTNIFKNPTRIKIQYPNYVFFNIGKWELRKSQDFMIKAFNAAFSPSDNVELRLIPQIESLNEETKNNMLKLIDESPLKHKIKLYNRLPTQYDLANFIWEGDCGLFLSRAEGWNNSILESMAINKPIIATNFSAHTEYCTNDNSFLVNINDLEVANDNVWFHGQGNWAKLGQDQFEQTVHYMRNVYRNNIKTNPAGLDTVKTYTWSKTANIIYEAMKLNGSFYANTKKKRKRR